MIKVVNIISDSNIGGAGRCVLNFLKYYDRNKFDVSVIVPRGSQLIPEIEKLKTEVIEADNIAEKSFDVQAIGQLMAIITNLRPDIVHTHGCLSGRFAAKACLRKVVYTRHSVFPVKKIISRQPGKYINKALNEYLADDIIAVAEAAKENLLEGGISAKKIKVILNGVEEVKPCTAEENRETREKYGLSESDFVVGIMARMEEYKGHKYLIDAAEILKKKGKNIKVLIAGTGAYEEELKRYTAEKQMEDTIIFAGFVSDVRRILGVMNVQANASYGTEATSLALLEGMSLGIPAVVSNYGGNPGVITHGENGYIFRTKDSEDMAGYLEKLYDEKETYEYMKKKSKKIFNSKFTADIYADNICEVYSGLVKNKRKKKDEGKIVWKPRRLK